MKNKLNPRQERFVAEYLKDGNASRAAVAAGYSPKAAKDRGWNLLHESPAVMNALEIARKEVAEKSKYNLEKAMNEAQEAIDFAKQTENANAYVKAVELRSKLNGLLIEKHDVRTVGFSINILGVSNSNEGNQNE